MGARMAHTIQGVGHLPIGDEGFGVHSNRRPLAVLAGRAIHPEAVHA